MPGRPARKAFTSAFGSISAGAAGVDQQRRRFHPRQIGRRDDAAGRLDQAHMQRQHVALFEQSVLAGARFRSRRPAPAPERSRAPIPALSCRTPCRSRQRRRRSGHSRRCRASCRAGCGRRRSAICRPCSAAICCGIARIAASTSAQVNSAVGVRRRAGMLAGRHDDAEPGTGVDIDVGIDAALADQLQLRQPLQQGARICVRSRISTSASVSRSRPASASTSWTWSFQIVTSCPASLAKQSRVRTVSK